MPRTGGNAQDRRRARRAAERLVARGTLAPADVAVALDFDELVAAATEPLSALPEDEALAQLMAFEADPAAEPTVLGEVSTATAVVGRIVVAPEGLSAMTTEFLRHARFVLADAPGDGVEASEAFDLVAARLQRRFERLAGRVSEWSTAAFAVGDVAWGPEDGFVDLICDLNELLEAASDDPYGSRLRAIDVGVRLDKALVCDYDDESYWSAPISIDDSGEPVLSDRDQWVPVEEGYVEVAASEEDGGDEDAPAEGEDVPPAVTSASRLRFELRDLVLTADAAVDLLPDEHKPGEKLPRRRAGVKPPAPTPPAEASEIGWRAIFVPEGELTDDGRAFAPGSLTWRELPLSLMAMTETGPGGHQGAVLAGRIDRIWREGNLVMAEGVFDGGEFGAEVARLVADQTLRGLSVDTAIHEYEVGPRSDYFDEDGAWRTEPPTRDEADDPDLADLLFGGDAEDNVFVVKSAVIGMATVCPFPAFAGASVSLVASGGGAVWRYSRQGGMVVVERLLPLVAAAAPTEAEEVEAEVEGDGTGGALPALEEGLTASAAGRAPLSPPAEWFDDPGLDALTPLTVDEDGRVFGHAWSWDTCHISFPDACVLAPHTETENAYFHLGEVECEGGERLPVGKVTIDAPHAGPRLSRADATAHYDHTGTVVAHVRCGEDDFGGWVAGAISPDLSAEKLRLLQGSALSGDWRNVNGNLELVALLAVNVPGFPVPRPRALVAAGADGAEERLALTAAGIVLEGKTPCEVVAEIAELAAEVAPPTEELEVELENGWHDVGEEFAALAEQAEQV